MSPIFAWYTRDAPIEQFAIGLMIPHHPIRVGSMPDASTTPVPVTEMTPAMSPNRRRGMRLAVEMDSAANTAHLPEFRNTALTKDSQHACSHNVSRRGSAMDQDRLSVVASRSPNHDFASVEGQRPNPACDVSLSKRRRSARTGGVLRGCRRRRSDCPGQRRRSARPLLVSRRMTMIAELFPLLFAILALVGLSLGTRTLDEC